MRSYDLVLILKPSLTEAKRKKLIETVKNWLNDLKIVKNEEWGEKVLSYSIKKEKTGYYLFLQLEGESIPTDFEKKLLTQEDIIRNLIVRKK